MSQRVVEIHSSACVATARRTATRLASEVGFADTRREQVALVVTEVGQNVLRHGGGGALILATQDHGGVGGVEVLAVDRGPGMADVERCLRDGYSTAGTAGAGLGAIARLSDALEIFSQVGAGTTLRALLWARALPAAGPALLDLGAVCVPMPGEEACGDGWHALVAGDRHLLMVADGLGHGALAAAASLAALVVLQQHAELGPAELLALAHEALRSTRGAAVAIAEVDLAKGALRYAGIGNIAGVVVGPQGRTSLVSHNGIVGHKTLRVREMTCPWPPGGTLIMHSDGLSASWDLGRYPGLLARHPALGAATLYRDFARQRDDATIVMARPRAEAP